MENILKLIEESALQVVMVDESDLQGLARMHTQFEEIEKQASDNVVEGASEQLALVQSASKAAAELINKIIMVETEDAAQAIQALGDTAKAMQTIVENALEGKTPEDIKFPRLLELEGASTCDTDEAAEGTFVLPDNVDEEIFREYLANQPHVLEQLEQAILTAENECSETNCDAIKALLHNMKGESALMGLDHIAAACHDAETILEQCKGPVSATAEKLLATKDWLQTAISDLQSGKIVNRNQQASSAEPAESAPEEQAEEAAETPDETVGIVIAEGDVPLVMDFINESNEHLQTAEGDLLSIEEDPEDSETLNSIFRAFHTIKGVAGFLNLSHIGALAHVTENLLDLARKGNLTLNGSSIDAVFEAIDLTKQMLVALHEAVDSHQPVKVAANLSEVTARIKDCAEGREPKPRLGNILVENGDTSRQKVREALHDQQTEAAGKKVGEILTGKDVVSDDQVDRAVRQQEVAARAGDDARNTAAATRKTTNSEATVKVTTTRLDSLINMVGELVIAQSMVSQDVSTSTGGDQRFERNLRHLSKITRDLQELAMSMRMVPVQGVFQKMARLVRDLSRKAGKQIELTMTGSETELDRNVVEAIADPLVHMVRNSVDHGVESIEDRRTAGKPETGHVELRAFHRAGNICIEIADDGRGLNKDKILKKAIDNGVVAPDAELTDKEIHELIFHAGLSTAEKVTDISGRGVGMDVVRKNIEALRGRIEIHSEQGKGTTFSISLPLTLAVIDGQIVTVGDNKFVIPTLSIEQSIKPTREQYSTVQGGQGEMMQIRGKLIPLVRLHRLFNLETQAAELEDSLVVVVADGGKRCAVQVDSLLGQQQVVIKSLGAYLGSVRGVAGGAIMGDGTVSLIMDTPGLIKLASDN